MKTPMQELKDRLFIEADMPGEAPFNVYYQQGYNDALRTIANDIEAELIKREKELIEDAWWDGHNKTGNAGTVNVPLNSPELYYNEKYSN